MNFLPYIKYLTEAQNWCGHGIHSPFAFDLAHNVMPEKMPYYAYARLQKIAGKQKNAERKRRELLFRILNNAAGKHLLVTGGSEADAMYLAAVSVSAVCIFISQNTKEDFFQEKGFQNIRVVKNLQEVFQYFPTLDFAFFGKTDEKEIAECLQHINKKTIFAFSDTYTKNAENWQFISGNSNTQLSIRTFRLALIYFNPDIQKGNYTLLY